MHDLKTELPVQTHSQPPHEGNFIRKLMVLIVLRAQHCGVSGVCAEVRRRGSSGGVSMQRSEFSILDPVDQSRVQLRWRTEPVRCFIRIQTWTPLLTSRLRILFPILLSCPLSAILRIHSHRTYFALLHVLRLLQHLGDNFTVNVKFRLTTRFRCFYISAQKAHKLNLNRQIHI